MPDPQTDPGTPPEMPGGLSLDSLIKGAMATPSGAPYVEANKRLDSIEAKREKELEPGRKKLADAAERTGKDEEEAFRRIPPLNLPDQPNQKDYQTDPLKAFGSWGSVFAQIASAFTHQPMINSLNAGAAAMNAMKANDAEAYKTAYEAWKDNTQIAIDRHKMAHEEFEDIVSMHKDNLQAMESALTVYGAKYNDQIALESIKSGNLDHMFQAADARERAYMGLLQVQPQLQEQGMLQWSAYDKDKQWLASPEGQAWKAQNPQVKGAPPQVHFKHYTEGMRALVEAKSPYGRGMSLSSEEAKGIEELVRSGVPFEDAIRRITGAASAGKSNSMSAEEAKAVEELVASGVPRDKAISQISQLTKSATVGAQESKLIDDMVAGGTPRDKAIDIVKKLGKDPTMSTEQARMVEDFVGSGMAREDALAKVKKIGQPTATLDDETLDRLAYQALSGDKSAYQGLGIGNVGATNRAALQRKITTVAKDLGMSGQDIANRVAEFQGLAAGERTLGTRTAQISLAADEAKELIPLALAASEKVDRTSYPGLNAVLLAGERGVGDENVVRLGVATNSLINVYARAISPTGTPTISDKDHARELLADAWSKGQYRAGIQQLVLEIKAAMTAPGQVKREFREQSAGAQASGLKVNDIVTSPDGVKHRITGFDIDGVPMGEVVK